MNPALKVVFTAIIQQIVGDFVVHLPTDHALELKMLPGLAQAEAHGLDMVAIVHSSGYRESIDDGHRMGLDIPVIVKDRELRALRQLRKGVKST